MSMGPITLFDKSFLQSLSLDESVWFDHFFLVNICPLFFVETLADLKKRREGRRAPEDEVRIIADKTPESGGGVNAFHKNMCVGNLLGQPVPMDGRILMSRGRSGRHGSKKGVLFEESPEAKAFSRWQRGEFQELEREQARVWRAAIQQRPDYDEVAKMIEALGIPLEDIKTLEAARDAAVNSAAGGTKFSKTFSLAVLMLGIPDAYLNHIFHRWHTPPYRPLAHFAPYAGFVFSIDLFFYICVARGLISGERLTNRVDMAYLYYLPFSMLFTSSDDLHRRCAPLFLRGDQEFIWGPELKEDLGRTNSHFSQLPEAEKERGVYAIASYPPPEARLLSRLWERFLPRARRNATERPRPPRDDATAVMEINKFTDALKKAELCAGDDGEPDAVILERSVRRKRGQWWQVPKDLPADS